MLYCRPDSPDQEWGLWLTGKQGEKVVKMAGRHGINTPRIITPSGSVGSFNPCPIPFTPRETFEDGYGVRSQAVMPIGHEVDAVRGPLPRWQRGSKLTRVQKRVFERLCFGVGVDGKPMEENDWLARHVVPKLIPEFSTISGHKVADRVLQLDGKFIRQGSYLRALAKNLAPRTAETYVRRRSMWHLPCVASCSRVIIGDSMVGRIPFEDGVKCVAFPGADVRKGLR